MTSLACSQSPSPYTHTHTNTHQHRHRHHKSPVKWIAEASWRRVLCLHPQKNTQGCTFTSSSSSTSTSSTGTHTNTHRCIHKASDSIRQAGVNGNGRVNSLDTHVPWKREGTISDSDGQLGRGGGGRGKEGEGGSKKGWPSTRWVGIWWSQPACRAVSFTDLRFNSRFPTIT